MIQRKQTLFLLAVAIIGILMLFVPVFEKSTWPVFLLPVFDSTVISSNIYYPIILNILVIVLSISVIFLYKNRILQYKLANLLILLNVFIIGLLFLLPYAKEGSINYEFGAFLPIIGAIFAFLAGHFIKKDEQLVRSSDRIR